MSNNDNIFPLSMFDNIKAHPENYRLIERIPLTIEGVDTHFPIKLNDPIDGEKLYSIVFLDTETTGMTPGVNKVIELGMVKATFSLQRKVIISVDSYYDEFEDPKETIPDEIVKLTGITNEMVEGHSFDDEMVSRFLSGRPLIVAHNASFDRPFFEQRFKSLNNLSWACSLQDPNWKKLGYPGAKLEYLNMHLGYFYDAHRAYVDCLALLWILYCCNDAFSMLIESALSKSVVVSVKGYTYTINNELKRLGFKFDSNNKLWRCNTKSMDEAKDLKDNLESSYKSGDVNFTVDFKEETARTRYKKFIPRSNNV